VKIYRCLIFSLILLALSDSCWLRYELIGSKLGEDRRIIESFDLIPLAWLFLFVGLIAGGCSFGIRVQG
jgi:hypothetical protein